MTVLKGKGEFHKILQGFDIQPEQTVFSDQIHKNKVVV